MKKGTCKNCTFLYIKDFITGICENPEIKRAVVNPDTSCNYFKRRIDINGK